MTLPRFRIKSLMIAVALAGIACWTVSMPEPGFPILVALMLLGPVAEIVRESRLPGPRRRHYLRSGVRGSYPVALILMVTSLLLVYSDFRRHSHRPLLALLPGAAVLVAGVALVVTGIGASVGLIAWAGSLLFSGGRIPANPAAPIPTDRPDPKEYPRQGTG